MSAAISQREPETEFWLSEHDRQHPFSIISNALIEDDDLSPQARFLLIFLLKRARIKDFKLKVRDLISKFKKHKGFGRDKIYEFIDELDHAGYLKKEKYLVNNLTRFSYGISEFKKFFRLPELQDPAKTDAYINKRKEEKKEKESINTLQKENAQDHSESLKTKTLAFEQPDANSLVVQDLVPIKSHKVKTEVVECEDSKRIIDLMLHEIKTLNPKALVKSIPSWKKETQLLLKHRTVDELCSIIKWVYADDFWKAVVMSPGGLKNNLDKIEIRMKSGSHAKSQVEKPSKVNAMIGDYLLKNENTLRKANVTVSKLKENEGICLQSTIGACPTMYNFYFGDGLFESNLTSKLKSFGIPFDSNHVKSILKAQNSSLG